MFCILKAVYFCTAFRISLQQLLSTYVSTNKMDMEARPARPSSGVDRSEIAGTKTSANHMLIGDGQHIYDEFCITKLIWAK